DLHVVVVVELREQPLELPVDGERQRIERLGAVEGQHRDAVGAALEAEVVVAHGRGSSSTEAGSARARSKTQPVGRCGSSRATAAATSAGECMRPMRFCAAIAANAASAVVRPRAATAAAAWRVMSVSTKPGQTA